MSKSEPFGTMGNVFQSIAEAMSEFVSSFERFLTGKPTVRQGNAATVSHNGLRFEGHICEYLSDNTVTIARKTDGVLIHVPRTSLVETKRRDD